MSEENTATRVETVTANIEAIIAKRGEEAFTYINSQCLQDISLSLAMLVDSSSNEETSGT